jgi:hypothetical protein
MNQLAWLDFHRGKWHLATSNEMDLIRRWADKKAALSGLAGEGRTVSGFIEYIQFSNCMVRPCF